MRHVTPRGEYVVEQRRVRFRVDPPWPLPGRTVVLECQPGVYGLIVKVDDLGVEGWIGGTIKGKAYGKKLSRHREMRGYD